jgi:hypothetical protein
MHFNSNQFNNAIKQGNYIDAVDQTLLAGPDDPKEELRDGLFRERCLSQKTRPALFTLMY